MTTRSMRRGRTTAAALLSGGLVAALAGCFPVGAGGGGTGSATEDSGSEGDPSNSEVDESQAPAWLDESDPQARAEACLVGTWTLDNDDWSAEIAATPEFEGGSADYSGEMVLDWAADGTYQMRADEHRVDARVIGNGADADVEVIFDGIEGGSWTSTGGTVFALDPSGESFTTTVSAEVDGYSVQVDAREIATDAWSGTLDMDCQVDTLASTVEDDGRVLTARWTRD